MDRSRHRPSHPRAWLAVLPVVAALLPVGGRADAPQPKDLAADVDPFVGTAANGITFPGADVPFGMVQFSPDTSTLSTSAPPNVPLVGSAVRPAAEVAGSIANAYVGASYLYGDTSIADFSLTHLSGAGCPLYGDVPLMPILGSPTPLSLLNHRSLFSHQREWASPGRYSVDLLSTAIHVDLTATTRTGWMRLLPPPTSATTLLIDSGRSLEPTGPTAAHLQIVDDRTVDVTVSGGGFCGSRATYTLFAHLRASQPVVGFGTYRGTTITQGSRTVDGPGSGGYLTFGPTGGAPLVLEIGLSYTSGDEAAANLAAEGAGRSFDDVAAAARAQWNELLGRVRVSGGSVSDRRTFVTALYHALQFPSTFSDADGSYRGFDGRVHRAVGWTQLANLSLWDTYRTQTPLLTLVAPDRAHDLARSLIADADEGGWLPKWPVANSESNTQQGDSAAPTLVEIFHAGLLSDAEATAAYRHLLHNATSTPPSSSPFAGRPYLGAYVQRGWVPFVSPLESGFPTGPSGGAAFATLFAASVTEEYALDDCDIAQMAVALGDHATASALASRATHWRNLFDPTTGYLRPRLADGRFFSPFDPDLSNVGFEEASAAEYLWLVPEDVPGLATLLGGPVTTRRRLDAFFGFPGILVAPEETARAQEAAGNAALVIHDIGQYSPDNEPDIQAPYLYLYVGAPWRTQVVVDAEASTYDDSPLGLPGNDDLGTLSAWYVLTAIGLYPMTDGLPVWGLVTPHFDHVEVDPGPPYRRHIEIDAPGASAGNRFVQSATLDGRPLDRSWLATRDLGSARITLTLAATPNPTWAVSSPPPSACTGPDGSGGLAIAATLAARPATRATGSDGGPAAAPAGAVVGLPDTASAARSQSTGLLTATGAAAVGVAARRHRRRFPKSRRQATARLN